MFLMAFSLSINFWYLLGTPWGHSKTLKTNYMLNLNNFLTKKSIFDLKASLVRAHEDLKMFLKH